MNSKIYLRNQEKSNTSKKNMVITDLNSPGRNGTNRIEAGLLAVLIFLMPLLYLSKTIDPVMTIRMLFLNFILLLVNIMIICRIRVYKEHFSIFRQFIFYAFAGYLLISALSLTQAINVSEGIFDLSKLIMFFALLIAGTLMLNFNEKNIILVCKTIIVISVIVAGIGMMQFFFNKMYFIPGASVVYSTFTNRNLFASILMISLSFSLYGYYTFSRFWSMISLVSICFDFFIFIVVKTRSVMFGIIFSLVVIFFVYLKNKQRLKKTLLSRKSAVLIGLIIIIIVLALLSLKSENIRKTSIGRKDLSSPGTLNIRWKAWEKTVPMIAEYPWLGVGIGNWKIMLTKYGVSGMKTEQGKYLYLRPHNDFIWVLAEIGVFGFLFFLAIFVLLIYYLLKVISRSTELNDVLFSLFLLFGICGYIIDSSFCFPKERIYHSVIFTLMISITAIKYNKYFPARKSKKTAFPAVLMIFNTLLLSSLLFYCYYRLKSEIHLYFSMQARRVMDHRVQITALSEIDTRLYNMSPTGIPIHWFRGIAFYELNQIELAFQDFSEAYQNHPHHIYILNNLASCYEIMGDHEKAIEFYNKVLNISPNFEESIINLSAVYYNMQDYAKAYETIHRCNEKTEDGRYKLYKEKIETKIKK